MKATWCLIRLEVILTYHLSSILPVCNHALHTFWRTPPEKSIWPWQLYGQGLDTSKRPLHTLPAKKKTCHGVAHLLYITWLVYSVDMGSVIARTKCAQHSSKSFKQSSSISSRMIWYHIRQCILHVHEQFFTNFQVYLFYFQAAGKAPRQPLAYTTCPCRLSHTPDLLSLTPQELHRNESFMM